MLGWQHLTLIAVLALTSLPATAHAPPGARLPTGAAKASPPSTAPAPLLPGTPSHTAGITPKAAPPIEARSLSIVMGGALKATLTTADLARVTSLPSPMSTSGKQTLWPLKDALSLFVHKDARVAIAVLEGGERVAIDEAMWRDPARLPVLWQNRRGLFKLGWSDAKGVLLKGTPELRDVRLLEVVPAAP